MATVGREISIADLAKRLGATVVGDAARVVDSVAPLADAGARSLSWCGDGRFRGELAGTRAAAVLLPADWAPPPGLTVVSVADPDLALCEVLEWLAPEFPAPPPGRDPSAVVASSARIADDVAIGPHVSVADEVEIGRGTVLHPGVRLGFGASVGRDCVLHANVVVGAHCRLGDRVAVHPNTTIGADGFGYLQRDGRHVKIPQIGNVVIEDDVEIGANSAIDRARSGETRIGHGTKIDNLVQVGHNCRIGPHCILVGGAGLSGSVTLGTGVVIAAGSGAADHVHFGDGAVLTGLSGVSTDVPAGAVYRGAAPAVPIHEFQRQHAAVRRLPKYVDLLRDLKRRVEELESAKND